jgi:hypothetical protein
VSTFEIGVARCTQLLWWTTPKVSSWCALARRVGKALSVCCWINGSATASPRLSYAFAEAIGGAKTFVVNHNDIMNTVKLASLVGSTERPEAQSCSALWASIASAITTIATAAAIAVTVFLFVLRVRQGGRHRL